MAKNGLMLTWKWTGLTHRKSSYNMVKHNKYEYKTYFVFK
jgi:hypothetical protein